MPRPERAIDPDDGPVAAFATKLREMRAQAGSPGYRELARRSAVSATTLAEAAGGRRMPTLEVTLAYVQAVLSAMVKLARSGSIPAANAVSAIAVRSNW